MLNRFARLLKRNTRGQDLIEYALMAGFVAVAAGAIIPGVASSINIVFKRAECAFAKDHKWVDRTDGLGGTCIAVKRVEK